MPLAIEKFIELRPWLDHLTARKNLPLLRARPRLYPAQQLIDEASEPGHGRRRVSVELKRTGVVIRDQFPLHPAHVDLAPGFTMEDLMDLLNTHVYFWPGTDVGPSSHGQRHQSRYRDEKPALLRVPTAALVRSDALPEPLFCYYNSDAPRTTRGRRSPRGPDLFRSAHDFHRTASRVVEVVFAGAVPLPPDTEEQTAGTSWKRLRHS